jgi:hypothetical protein
VLIDVVIVWGMANAEFARMLGNTKMAAAAITAAIDIIFCVLFMLS